MSIFRRFYSDYIRGDSCITIEGDELFHLKAVIRGKAGNMIEIINGKGSLVWGEIKDISKDQARAQVRKMYYQEKPATQIILAPSLLKKKSMNDLIEKLTEMGIDEIRPVMYERTDASCSPSVVGKWDKIAIQSLKINRRLWKPFIAEPVRIDQILSLSEKTSTKILLDIDREVNLDIPWIPPVISVIGPPGDFTPEEKELFKKNDFIPFRLNDSILRTETAAISISAILKMKSGWG
jgi:16S rRNA (uracil1498-N3)-methyltransferase